MTGETSGRFGGIDHDPLPADDIGDHWPESSTTSASSSLLASLVEIVVGTANQISKRFVFKKLCDTCRGRCPTANGQFRVDHLEAPLHPRDVESEQPAQELVASIANKKVVRSDIVSDGVGNQYEKLITGFVTVYVIDRLETIDVNESQSVGIVRSPRSDHFSL